MAENPGWGEEGHRRSGRAELTSRLPAGQAGFGAVWGRAHGGRGHRPHCMGLAATWSPGQSSRNGAFPGRGLRTTRWREQHRWQAAVGGGPASRDPEGDTIPPPVQQAGAGSVGGEAARDGSGLGGYYNRCCPCHFKTHAITLLTAPNGGNQHPFGGARTGRLAKLHGQPTGMGAGRLAEAIAQHIAARL